MPLFEAMYSREVVEHLKNQSPTWWRLVGCGKTCFCEIKGFCVDTIVRSFPVPVAAFSVRDQYSYCTCTGIYLYKQGIR